MTGEGPTLLLAVPFMVNDSFHRETDTFSLPAKTCVFCAVKHGGDVMDWSWTVWRAFSVHGCFLSTGSGGNTSFKRETGSWPIRMTRRAPRPERAELQDQLTNSTQSGQHCVGTWTAESGLSGQRNSSELVLLIRNSSTWTTSFSPSVSFVQC